MRLRRLAGGKAFSGGDAGPSGALALAGKTETIVLADSDPSISRRRFAAPDRFSSREAAWPRRDAQNLAVPG